MSWEKPKYTWDEYYEDNSELFTTPEAEIDPLDLTEISFSEISLDELDDDELEGLGLI